MPQQKVYRFYGWQVPLADRFGLTPAEYYDLLSDIWSADTCAPRMRGDWRPENRTLGQCSITAFLMQELFGGRVCGVPLPEGGVHCFNMVDGHCFDLTSEQFGDRRLTYRDCQEQFREVHFAKEEKLARYRLLKHRLLAALPGSMETRRLVLRPWLESDAPACFKYAADPLVGPPAGWPPHRDEADSARIIRQLLAVPETWALALKETGEPVGCIGLKCGANTDLTDRQDECELGYWLGRPYWGQGLMPEAVRAVLRHAFEDLGMRAVWCGYYEGNVRSLRVQEKCGFRYHHATKEVPVPLMGEVRRGYVNRLTKEEFINMPQHTLTTVKHLL